MLKELSVPVLPVATRWRWRQRRATEEVSWDRGFMFYSYSRREQRKALHTGTHPAAVVRQFKIDPGTNGQQELGSSQRLVSIRLNRPHIHYHISSQSAAAVSVSLSVGYTFTFNFSFICEAHSEITNVNNSDGRGLLCYCCL